MKNLFEKIDSIPSKWLATGGVVGMALLAVTTFQSAFVFDLFKSFASSNIDPSLAPSAIQCSGPTVVTRGSTFALTVTGGSDTFPLNWYDSSGAKINDSNTRTINIKRDTAGTYEVVVINGNPADTTVPTRTAKCSILVQ
jgi:hypothetical protein